MDIFYDNVEKSVYSLHIPKISLMNFNKNKPDLCR